MSLSKSPERKWELDIEEDISMHGMLEWRQQQRQQYNGNKDKDKDKD